MLPLPCVAILGTCDTKLEELMFLRDEIKRYGVDVELIDVGRTHTNDKAIDISQRELLEKYSERKTVDELPRGEVIMTMADCATRAVEKLLRNGSIHAIINAGGSGGTSLAAQVMRTALPIGFPKMLVSTVASGDTGPIVGETDITMMYSVVDIAGLNQVLRNVLSNAGAAIAGMSRAFASRLQDTAIPKTKRVGITMFGVTTPGVDCVRKYLESNYDIETYVFHATGHGGKAMERLVKEGGLDAVIDFTTTEICDLITGGVMSAGEHRLEAAAQAGLPYIVSVGATDMTNFGPIDTVPDKYKGRKLYEHNPVVTLMRTSKEEAAQVGGYIAAKLKGNAKDPNAIQVFLPHGGISMIAAPGGPFEDTEADAALFSAIREGLQDSSIMIIEEDSYINDKTFAYSIANALIAKIELSRKVT